MSSLRIIVAALCLVALAINPSGDSAAETPVDFQTQIAPIFQQHCVRCHQSTNAKGDFSLSNGDALFENDYAIPGDPDASHLSQLITSGGAESPEMPRDAAPLSDNDVALIRRWIAEGAVWPGGVVISEKSKADGSWWSLQPIRVDGPEKPPPVANSTSSAEGPSESIDAFIDAKLDANQLQRSPPADRRTLIRRLSFDLHGLPPTFEEVESFVNDPDPDAYDKLVDRLLDSPHYGEHYARHWLDIAHYADTHGFERDMRRDNAWRYRDYVIDAFNSDKPYDRFIQEQIAGDVLWPDDDEAIVATGFLAAGPWDHVGQVETKSPLLRRAARSLDLDDMATQVMTSTMAMTINCARCHDHKLDPISQREYYQLRSVFAGVKRDDRVISDARSKRYEQEKQSLTDRLNDVSFQIARLERSGLDLADIVGGGSGLGSGTYRNGIDVRNAKIQTRDFGKLGNVKTNTFSPSQYAFVDGVFVPDGGEGDAMIPVSTTGTTITGLPKTSGDAWDMIRNGPVASQHSTELSGVDFTAGGYSLLALHANAGITFDIAAIRSALVDRGAESADLTEIHFTAKLGYFGAAGNFRADAWIFVDGRKTAAFRGLNRDAGLQSVDVALPSDARFLTLVATDGGNGISHDQIGFGDPLVSLSQLPEMGADDQQRLDSLRIEQTELNNELAALGPPPRFYGVVTEDQSPDVHLLVRGDPESPTGPALPPAAIEALTMLDAQLGGLDADPAIRRARLAQWITHRDNPLMRRVIVNRLWHWLFGRGIVDTPSDFGFGGGRPSHPELLDWLATQFDRNNGSLKAINRLILTSETYKQSSAIRRSQFTQRALQSDSDNRLLWRQNPRRIEAESIRDTVLLVSGKLNLQRGGPGFEDFEYQDAYAPIYNYVTADAPGLWRRSIYRYIVRTSPDRFLTTLDCPDPANLTPKRLTTTTPLQSLALYNNAFMLKQAEYFADRIRQEVGSDTTSQVRRAFQIALARDPSNEEIDLARNIVDDQPLFTLCRVLFNANEFVYVD